VLAQCPALAHLNLSSNDIRADGASCRSAGAVLSAGSSRSRRQ
jgi:hypothetical protein